MSKLPKGSYGVFDIAAEAEIEHAIETVIDEDVQIGKIGNEPLFRLGQYVKPIVSPSESPADMWEPIIQEFYDQHEELQECYDFFEVKLMWGDIWDNDKIENPKMDWFKIALMRADKMTEVRPEAQWCGDTPLLRLDNYCFQLQKLRGEQPICISQYQAGEIIGKDPRMGRRAIDNIERKKNLKIHIRRKAFERLSNEYFYVGQAEPVKKPTPRTEAESKQQQMIDDLRQSEGEQ